MHVAGHGRNTGLMPSGNNRKNYENAMAKRYATTRIGTGTNDYGYTGQGITRRSGADYGKKGSFGFPLGGFGGGGRGGAAFAEEDLQRQLEYDKAIWERSTPDVTGVGGQARWDRDKNMLTTSLSPENQAIYDSMVGRQKMFAGNVDSLAGGGWQDAYQQQFDSMRNMYSASDAREEARRLERQNATGASSTGIFQEDANAAALKNQRNLELQNTAFLQSQQLIDSELAREYGAVGMMSNLGNIANSMAVMPTPNTAGNMQNVSTASTRWADNLAMESAKRAKGKSDFWGSILGSLFK
jgi:hypothetical protein